MENDKFDDGEFEEEIKSVEDEIEEESEKEATKEKTPTSKKQTPKQNEEITETYEAFIQPERVGLTNTLTGETIEGFDEEKDKGHILAYRAILNKLNEIAIASGI